MNKFAKKVLTLSAKLSKKVAVKSCGATSIYDLYQPEVPKAVLEMAKNNKK
ncbi:MAG: cyclic lactone autoinducer peptide [Oscillospiraceae bacterium]|nr:cyclic lactone autoinducer peptide [Oscillospiraceae bacterium]